MTTVFGKIIRKEIPAEIVYEDEDIIAIKDIAPAAPVHILILPKKEIRDLQSVEAEDLPLIGKIVSTAQQLAKEFGVENGYRLLTNNGSQAGQSVFHLHFHLIGGKHMPHLGV